MDTHIIESGFFDTGTEHKLYFELWGNPDATTPIIFLHGGPGGGFDDGHKLKFDPNKHKVLFFDQRGSGKSTPYASTERNTTQDLIQDIYDMCQKFGFEHIYLHGRSWGSLLALAYAVAYPTQVKKLLIGGVYLGTPAENDIINLGQMRNFYPEAWERFSSIVPKENRTNGQDLMRFFIDKFNSSDKQEAKRYADEWTLWEVTHMSLKYDKSALEQAILQSDNLALAKLEAHYYSNNCFLPANYIMNNIDTIRHIPCYVVHGRFDTCTPPATAVALQQAYGEQLMLQWVTAGHRASEPETRAAEVAVLNTYFT
jgi:proline iminopeptidase